MYIYQLLKFLPAGKPSGNILPDPLSLDSDQTNRVPSPSSAWSEVALPLALDPFWTVPVANGIPGYFSIQKMCNFNIYVPKKRWALENVFSFQNLSNTYLGLFFGGVSGVVIFLLGGAISKKVQRVLYQTFFRYLKWRYSPVDTAYVSR